MNYLFIIIIIYSTKNSLFSNKSSNIFNTVKKLKFKAFGVSK